VRVLVRGRMHRGLLDSCRMARGHSPVHTQRLPKEWTGDERLGAGSGCESHLNMALGMINCGTVYNFPAYNCAVCGKKAPPASANAGYLSPYAYPVGSFETATVTTTPMPALFCFSVMQSTGYEAKLLSGQYEQGAGIFGCERRSVFSDLRLNLAANSSDMPFYTENIGDLHCEFGGPFYPPLALNSEIFVRAWKQVIEDGQFLSAKWTTKVDPDCVFMANRLRILLKSDDEDSEVYFNNCDAGLHGPIEVISRGGMKVLAKGLTECSEKLADEFDSSGEDVFLRHCLGRLKVNRVDQFKLLSEDHCFGEDPEKDGCYSGKVSFHPFKSPEKYFKCRDQAAEHEWEE